MNLRELQQQSKVWTSHNFPNAQWFEPALGISEEVGELHHALLKMHQGIRGTKESHTAATKDALGDMLIYMVDLANKLDIDLQECMEETWSTVQQRDWIKNPTNGVTR